MTSDTHGGFDNPGSIGGAGRARRVSFVDTLLPDGAVERAYDSGVRERRVAREPGVVEWSDSQGAQGRDLDLGEGRVRREVAGGVMEGRQVGNGVTVWSDGQLITVNETPLPEQLPVMPAVGGLGGLLLGLGLGGLFGLGAASANPYGLDPNSDEYALYAEQAMQQEQLRRAQQAQTTASGSSTDGSSSGDFGFDDDRDDHDGDGDGDGDGADSFG